MVKIEARTRKWGNSLGVILPKESVRKGNIQENQKITIELKSKQDLSSLRGLLKTKKNSTRT